MCSSLAVAVAVDLGIIKLEAAGELDSIYT
jgi:hypothetical protein